MSVSSRSRRKISLTPYSHIESPASPWKAIFIASTGGHLAQLHRLAKSIPHCEDSLWVTFDSPQSRSLLEGRRSLYTPYVASRDTKGTLLAGRQLLRELRGERFDIAISTGAALALGSFMAAAARGIPRVYIESVSRTAGPSLTGRLVHASRLVTTYTQHQGYPGNRWHPAPSVLRSFTSRQVGDLLDQRPLRIFVSLGTIRPYRFDRLVNQVLNLAAPDDHIVWQLGETSRSDLANAHSLMTDEQFTRECHAADVVVTHAGVGTLLKLLEAGIKPVLVPRISRLAEHVDDHQLQIATLARDADIAIVPTSPLTRADLLAAASATIF